jgi:hypothetical protein
MALEETLEPTQMIVLRGEATELEVWRQRIAPDLMRHTGSRLAIPSRGSHAGRTAGRAGDEFRASDGLHL